MRRIIPPDSRKSRKLAERPARQDVVGLVVPLGDCPPAAPEVGPPDGTVRTATIHRDQGDGDARAGSARGPAGRSPGRPRCRVFSRSWRNGAPDPDVNRRPDDLKVASATATQLDSGAATLRVGPVALPVREAGALGGGFEQQVMRCALGLGAAWIAARSASASGESRRAGGGPVGTLGRCVTRWHPTRPRRALSWPAAILPSLVGLA
jgi:hypothetical protein